MAVSCRTLANQEMPTMSTPDSSPTTFLPGMSVVDANGRTGTVEEVVADTGDPATTELAVRWDDVDDVEFVSAAGLSGAEMMTDDLGAAASSAAMTPADVDYSQPMADVTAEALAGDTVETSAPMQTAAVTTPGAVASSAAEAPAGENPDELVIPVREEVLVPTTHETDMGKVVIHKRIETVPVNTSVDVERQQVSVERVAINRQVETAPGPRQEGDTLVIPVIEEVLFTEKRLMLTEEIRVTRKRITESVAVEETLRREVVEFEERPTEMPDTVGGATTTQTP